MLLDSMVQKHSHGTQIGSLGILPQKNKTKNSSRVRQRVPPINKIIWVTFFVTTKERYVGITGTRLLYNQMLAEDCTKVLE
jgi:hypothetical protein